MNEKEQKRYEKREKRTQSNKKRSEKLPKREIENLMGMHDAVYERHNHALRRKGR